MNPAAIRLAKVAYRLLRAWQNAPAGSMKARKLQRRFFQLKDKAEKMGHDLNDMVPNTAVRGEGPRMKKLGKGW